jgi:hypothetical protein
MTFNHAQTVVQFFSALSVSVMISGCASFPSGKLPVVSELPDQSSFTRKPSMYFTLRFVSDLSGDQHPPLEFPENHLRAQRIIDRVVREAAMFDGYTFQSFGPAAAEYGLQVEFLNYGSHSRAMGAGLITAYSLFLIPSAVSDNYRLEAKLLNQRGEVLKTYRYEDTVRTWFGVWMLPVCGKSSRKAFDSVIENMTRSLLRDLLRDEVLPFSNQAAAVNAEHAWSLTSNVRPHRTP